MKIYRRAFTVVELLVVVAIVGSLFGLLLAAVQAARETSRKVACVNNLRQLGVALSSFQSVTGHYPPASPSERNHLGKVTGAKNISPHTMLLPFLDLPQLYNSINLEIKFGDQFDIAENHTAVNSKLNIFICPSEISVIQASERGANSYRANIGPSPYFWDQRFATLGVYPGGGGGAFPFLYEIGPVDFTDGLHATAMLSEKLMGSGVAGAYDKRRDHWCLGWGSVQYPPGGALVNACQSRSSHASFYISTSGKTWFSGDFGWTWYNHLVAPNWSGESCKVDGCAVTPPEESGNHGGIFGASSSHASGVNCLLGDGSVSHVKNSINSNAWKALSTRSGSDAIDEIFIR